VSYPKLSKGMLTHPFIVQTLEGLPESLRDIAADSLPPDEEALASFVVPANVFIERKRANRQVPEQALIFTTSGVLHVRADQPPVATFISAKNVFLIQHRLILLYGRLDILDAWESETGQVQVNVEYNTVGEYLLRPWLTRLIRQTQENESLYAVEPDRTRALLDELEERSLKFRNGVSYYGLQPEERILGYVYQPTIFIRNWLGLRRIASPATALFLTDRQVIIEEEEKTDVPGKYGWIFTYIPRSRIRSIETIMREDLAELHFHLGNGEFTFAHTLVLAGDSVQDWLRLWDKYHPVAVPQTRS